jgi:microcystin-dependent protein
MRWLYAIGGHLFRHRNPHQRFRVVYMSEPFVGQVVMFAGNFAPRDWAFCNGQIIPIAQNTALFSLLGTSYGGNGQTNFGLPDLRGRVPVGFSQDSVPGLTSYFLGEVLGAETVTLNITTLPAHTHAASAGSSGNQLLPTNNYWAADGTGTIAAYSDKNADTTINQQVILPTGGGQAHNNVQPVLALNFIIALQGVFPTRG